MVGPVEPVLSVGRYELYAPFASGGMARVHFGRLTGAAGFSRVVAVKRLHAEMTHNAELVSMLTDEARLASRVRHPNVVGIVDVVEAERELLLVMDYVHGESLATLLGRAPKPPLGVSISIAASVLEGLHAAHVATDADKAPLGIVHRDVSPHNVIVGADGVARLIDFGIARAVSRVSSTAGNVVKGKPRYMAPEQLGEGITSVRTDVYSASVVLWEMLTGKPLFASDNDETLFGRVLEGVVTPPSRICPDVSSELETVVMRGLSRQPGDRYATAQEMARAVRDAAAVATVDEVAAWVDSVADSGLRERGDLVRAIELRDPGAPEPVPAAASTPPPEKRALGVRIGGVAALVALAVALSALALRDRSDASPTAVVPHPDSFGSAPSASASASANETPAPVASAPPAVSSAPSSAPIARTSRPPTPAGLDCNPPTTTDERGIRRIQPGCAAKR